MRADTAGCVLADDLDETETEVRVRTTRGPAWVTTTDHPDCLPFDITVGGEVIRVLASDDENDDTQRFTVERSITGLVKPHGEGTAVQLAYSATAARSNPPASSPAGSCHPIASARSSTVDGRNPPSRWSCNDTFGRERIETPSSFASPC